MALASAGSSPVPGTDSFLQVHTSMLYVYALKSKTRNYIYVGMTANIKDRMHRHNSGYEKTTRSYRPFELIYLEAFDNRKQAREKEKYLKSGSGKEYLKKIVNQLQK
ncbi:MAG: GIY-YIG nuclease family protein [Ignavibacterium sp.]